MMIILSYEVSTIRGQGQLYGHDNQQRDVEMHAGLTGWLPAQQHSGHNIGDTDTHVIFVELKEGNAAAPPLALGPE